MVVEPARKWTTVRIAHSWSPLLGELSEDMGLSRGDVVGVALDRLRRQKMLDDSNKAYARMLADPEAAKAWEKEIGIWDSLPDDELDEL
ncbi:MAG: hypothetical protein L6427_11370 [Actinomycetia bacterium]|nr:hypothetical protein [Actinomycetes bacterium]